MRYQTGRELTASCVDWGELRNSKVKLMWVVVVVVVVVGGVR